MLFDNYTLKARFYPVVILFIPLVIVGIFYSVEFEKIYLLLTSIGVGGALMYLFSQLGRDQGKMKEKELWKGWGGAPSTQLLRLTDERIDKFTKKRYHNKMLLLCPVDSIPDTEMERYNLAEADQVYIAWSKYLISKTRDAKKFSLLLKDNTSYGFRRNLWGLKWYGIILSLILIVGNYIFWELKLNSWDPLVFPASFQYSTLTLVLIIAFWMFVVTRNWVKVPAFAYAERLCETIDNIN
jgi:hypothetical protein